jgi:hypothetical protein
VVAARERIRQEKPGIESCEAILREKLAREVSERRQQVNPARAGSEWIRREEPVRESSEAIL